MAMSLHHFHSTLLYDNLLLSLSFIYSHPLHLAYLLYFSPYFLQLISFLFPLLLTTSILVSLLSIHFKLEGETATVCLLTQVSSTVVDSIGNVFQWEIEAMSELYKDLGLHCKEVGEDPVEIFTQSSQNSELQLVISAKSELMKSDDEWKQSQFHRQQTFEPENSKHGILGLNCDVREVPVEISSDHSSGSEVFESEGQDISECGGRI